MKSASFFVFVFFGFSCFSFHNDFLMNMNNGKTFEQSSSINFARIYTHTIDYDFGIAAAAVTFGGGGGDLAVNGCFSTNSKIMSLFVVVVVVERIDF